MFSVTAFCPIRALLRNGNLSEFQLAAKNGLIACDRNDEFLMVAVKYGRKAFVQYLVERGADVHACDDQAVRWASTFDHKTLVRFLVGRGADIRARGGECVRAATTYGFLELVRYLVAIGADIRCIEHNFICRQFYSEIFRDLAKHLILRGVVCGCIHSNDPNLCNFKRAFMCAQLDAPQASRAARRIYFGWLPRCFDLARRSGRRTRARNFRVFRRLCDTRT